MKNIIDDIFYVGSSNFNQKKFEGEIPLETGMAYNSYLIIDEKTCLLDTVDCSVKDDFIKNVKDVLGNRALDYLIVHHLEPDHTGAIFDIVKLFPNVTICISGLGYTLLQQFFHQTLKNVKIVKEGDVLSLGKHELHFIAAPMVHWPEVLVSYESSSKTLFSSDAFGAFGATTSLFLPHHDIAPYLPDLRRYYTNIVGKYGPQVQDLLNKASNLDIEHIMPLHGFILNSEDIPNVLKYYNLWSLYQEEEKGVLIVYASIYGHTAEAAERLAHHLEQKNINHDIINLNKTDPSYALEKTFVYKNVILLAPTFNMGLFPLMENFILMLKAHLVKNKVFMIVENGSWAPNAKNIMCKYLQDLSGNEIYNKFLTIKSSITEEQETLLYKYVEDLLGMKEEKKEVKPMRKWQCKICGFVYEGTELPEDFHCPICGHPASDFVEIDD